MNFNSNQAGRNGYLFYVWTDDGSFNHVEYTQISEDGVSYTYWNNRGFEEREKIRARTFAQDSNAVALDDGNGIVRFVPLN